MQTRQTDVPLPEGVIPVTQLSGRRWKGIVMMKKTLVLLAVATILTSVPGCGTLGKSPRSVSPFKTDSIPAATQSVGNTTRGPDRRVAAPGPYVERDALIEASELASPIPEADVTIFGPQLIDPASGTNPI